MTKLQSILQSIAVIGATVGSDFIHSAKGQEILTEVLAAIEAAGEIVAVEAASKPAA